MSALDGYERIRIVSLPERTDRRRAIGRDLERIGLDRHPDVAFFDAIRPGAPERFPSVGALGCFLSHETVLREAARDGIGRLLVLEDDAMVREDRLPATVPDGCEVAYFGGDPIGAVPPAGATWWTLDHGTGVIGSHAYGVTRRVIEAAPAHLEAMRGREPGDPAGGPMQFDGGLHWLRRALDADVRFCSARPFVQRPSRTDVHPLAWYDRVPVGREVVNALRTVLRRSA